MKNIAECLLQIRSMTKDFTLPEDKTDWDWERIKYDIRYANQWYEKQLEIWRQLPITTKADRMEWLYDFFRITGTAAFQSDGLLFGETIYTKENSLGRKILRFLGIAQSLRKEQ